MGISAILVTIGLFEGKNTACSGIGYPKSRTVDCRGDIKELRCLPNERQCVM